jgi:glycosyltransferase involved in cell wall biosynthesis
LNARVVINKRTYEDFEEQYRSVGASRELLNRIVTIENGVAIPASCEKNRTYEELKVLYVGRGSEEKRVHLIGRAASSCYQRGVSVSFTFVGDVLAAIKPEDRPYCVFYPETADTIALGRFYSEADVVVLTSSREGFPLVIMEAMAHGTVPVCTPVGGIPYHIKHGVNGMITIDGAEDSVTGSLVEILEALHNDRVLLEELSKNAREYALRHFDAKRFNNAYRLLLMGESAFSDGTV